MAYKHATVADLLGVKPKKAETTLTLAYSVQKGLPVSALDRFAGRVSPQARIDHGLEGNGACLECREDPRRLIESHVVVGNAVQDEQVTRL